MNRTIRLLGAGVASASGGGDPAHRRHRAIPARTVADLGKQGRELDDADRYQNAPLDTGRMGHAEDRFLAASRISEARR
ncbi:hypothetical protein [Nocardia lijiangensis]|uniref:hypothetical protein n=1 Tax=Nocardia lijiangensis TaxID=299618 RepID=UPI000835EDA6|nr:hypothetical protein [Nocardia lijiangensis]